MKDPPPSRDAEKRPSGKMSTVSMTVAITNIMLRSTKKIRPSFGTVFSVQKTYISPVRTARHKKKA